MLNSVAKNAAPHGFRAHAWVHAFNPKNEKKNEFGRYGNHTCDG